jgi:hypothetical protein
MPNYTLNFAPISLSGKTTIFVGTQPYSKEGLHELRQQYRDTHVFRRRGKDDTIVDIPVAAGAVPLGNLQEEVELSTRRSIGRSCCLQH